MLNPDTQETCPCFSDQMSQSIPFWPQHMKETQSLSLRFKSLVDPQEKVKNYTDSVEDQK